MAKKSKFGKALREAAILAVFGTVVGFIFNTFSANGIPLVATEPPRLSLKDPRGLDILETYEIGLEEAKKAWDNGKALFIDSRERAKFEKKHLPTAECIPYDEFDDHVMNLDKLVRSGLVLVIYCDGADCDSSVLLTQSILDTFKDREGIFERIKIFYDGWNKWLKAGLDTVTGEE